jgi:HEAT repeat protein
MATLVPLLALAPLLALHAAPVPGGPPGPALERQDEGQEDDREDVAALLEALGDHVKEKGREDAQAIGRIDELTRLYDELGPKDRARVVKALDRCFKAKRPKEIEEGVPDDRLHFAAATALGEMGPESVKPLIGLLGHKSFRRNLRLQARVAKSIGRTGDPDGVKPLLALLEHKDKELQAAGAQALSSYDGEPGKVRKQIFKALLDVLTAQKAEKDDDSSDLEAFERWSTISGPFIATMQALSGHDERRAEAWQRWWNENKKGDWDA